jgi:predicted HicB family RNase H-like nuclease
VTYEGVDVPGLQQSFREAVESYLQTCAELGREPETTCKGTFNVRIPPELHKALNARAIAEDKSLNEVVKAACYQYVERRKVQIVNHKHDHYYYVGASRHTTDYRGTTRRRESSADAGPTRSWKVNSEAGLQSH